MPTRLIATTKFLCLLGAIILFTCPVAKPQTPACTLKAGDLKPAEDFYGLRLGMTTEEVKKALPLIELGRADRLGVRRTSFNPHFDSRVDKTAFPDVRTISLDFLDDKLATVWIGYENTFKWPKLDVFVANFSKSLGVSPEWQPARNNGRALICDGFSVYALMIAGGPSLRINDEAAQTVVTARLAEAIDADEQQVVGNSITRNYYPSDCSGKDSVPKASRTVFKNKEEAEKAGYTLSKDCQ
jgi:hypothetical protein